MSSDRTDFAQLLRQSRIGNRTAVDQIIPLVYDELRRLARAFLRTQRPGHSLQPTALVHEAYIRLADLPESDWQNRQHFLSLAANIMRHVLVDHARAKCAAKRGGGRVCLAFQESLNYSEEKASDLVHLDDALNALAAFDNRKARTLELRYFGGLTLNETADVMGLSVATVVRETRYAEAWLRRELQALNGSNATI